MRMFENLEVSNIYLYVADAVRWDFKPDQISEQGTCMKTIASSIHTPTSFPSIITGLHPPQHKVWDFKCTISDIPTILDIEGYNTGFMNTIDQKFGENPETEKLLSNTLEVEQKSPNIIKKINDPFILVERGPGGHSPYCVEFEGTAWDYFHDRGASKKEKYRKEYKESVQQDTDWFLSRMNELEKRGLLEDTLVIYTSDHGELLGEGGSLGHNSPIHPCLVNVPTVFIHPEIPNQNINNGVLRHVDIPTTIYSLLNTKFESIYDLSVKDLTVDELAGKGTCFYSKSIPSGTPLMEGDLYFESVWDYEGGFVFPKNQFLKRTAFLFGKLMKSATKKYMRRHLLQNVPFYLKNTRKYGNPDFSKKDATEFLDRINSLSTVEETENIDEVSEKQLRDLGYMS